MDTPTINAPQGVEGQEATPASPQATVPETQVPAQPQPTPISPVETNPQPTREESSRASDFETARQIKNLTKQVRSLMQQVSDRNTQSAPPQNATQSFTPSPVTQQELLADPLNAINRILDARDKHLMGIIPQTLSQRDQELRTQRDIQEGWKIIRSSEAYKNDPDGEDKINDILAKEDAYGNSLQKYSTFNPVHAAQLALIEYEKSATRKVPATAPQKAQMVSTATASYPGGAQLNVNEEALKLQQEAYSNPDVMKDPSWKARLANLTQTFNKQKEASLAG